MTIPKASKLRSPKGRRGECVSGKVRYATRKAAEESLARLLKLDYPTHTETRAFTCDRCGGVHLTSDAEHEFVDPRNP